MFREWFTSVRSWPKSLYQSIEDPTQEDRLPDSSAVELEYPTHQYTPAQNRRHAFFMIAVPAFAGLVLFIMEHYTRRPFAPYVHASLAAFGLTIFTWAYFGRIKSWWRWPVYFLLYPFLRGWVSSS